VAKNGTDQVAQHNLKVFVHEVLRKSRSSGIILQAALCYIEAVRPKIPALIRQEQSEKTVAASREIRSCGRVIKAEDLSGAEAEAEGTGYQWLCQEAS
jgi:hypothetical protein